MNNRGRSHLAVGLLVMLRWLLYFTNIRIFEPSLNLRCMFAERCKR